MFNEAIYLFHSQYKIESDFFQAVTVTIRQIFGNGKKTNQQPNTKNSFGVKYRKGKNLKEMLNGLITLKTNEKISMKTIRRKYN